MFPGDYATIIHRQNTITPLRDTWWHAFEIGVQVKIVKVLFQRHNGLPVTVYECIYKGLVQDVPAEDLEPFYPYVEIL